MSVLVISAHPDDEVLGCGGTIARLAREGREVYIAILGEGLTSRKAAREDADPEAIAGLADTARTVARNLGAKNLFLRSLPDNRLDTVPLLEVVKMIEDLVEEVRPEVVYTHHGGDLNVDHSVIFRATLTATRPLKDQVAREIYTYEVPSSTEWAFQRLAPRFTPNCFVDIGETIETKLQAMETYDSEARTFPHPRSPQSLRAIARRWGSVAGMHFAEAFEIVRLLR